MQAQETTKPDILSRHFDDVPLENAHKAHRLEDPERKGMPTFTATGPLKALDPVLRHHATIVDERRMAVLEEGMLMEAVDPANVGVTGAWVPAERFPTYMVQEEGVFAVDLSDLRGAVSRLNSNELDTVVCVRNANDDELPGDIDAGLTVAYNLPVPDDAAQMKYTDTFGTIDPASVRTVPDPIYATGALEDMLHVAADVNMYAFHRFLDAVDGFAEHVHLHAQDGDLTAESETDVRRADVTLQEGTPEFPGSLFSLDYLTDMFNGPLARDLKRMDATVHAGTECPMFAHAALPGYTMNGDTTKEGGAIWSMLAPRIQSE